MLQKKMTQRFLWDNGNDKKRWAHKQCQFQTWVSWSLLCNQYLFHQGLSGDFTVWEERTQQCDQRIAMDSQYSVHFCCKQPNSQSNRELSLKSYFLLFRQSARLLLPKELSTRITSDSCTRLYVKVILHTRHTL